MLLNEAICEHLLRKGQVSVADVLINVSLLFLYCRILLKKQDFLNRNKSNKHGRKVHLKQPKRIQPVALTECSRLM